MRPVKSCSLVILLCLGLFSARLSADAVSVAVAANFTDATRKLAPLFEQASGHRLKISYGSTGKLYAQIEHGAPFEVFLAADSERPLMAEQAGLAVPGSRFVYARGRLALWSAKHGPFEAGEPYLKAKGFRHLAIANPKTAPYGQAAQQVLERLGLWSKLQTRLVRGDSIAQTFQFVATANAEAGFVAYSQVMGWQGEAGSVWLVPQDYYQPIEQSAVLLQKGVDSAAARAFLEFLQSDSVKAVIEGFGYGVD